MKQRGLFDWVPAVVRRKSGGRKPRPKTILSDRTCERCGTQFTPARKHQRFCEARCRAAANALRDYYKHREQRRADENRERQKDRDKWREYQRARYAVDPKKHAAQAREWREKNKDHVLNAHLQRTYGISVHEFNRMLREQGGCCAICGAREGKSKSGGVRLHVDHDHLTGKPRGLLCGTCNRGIGQLGDDLERVLAAVRYLERSQVTPKPKKDEESA